MLCEAAGADGITAHLREDRRHIQDRDIELLKTRVTTFFNLEMACTDEMLERAKRNIEGHFAVVGITERFDESLILLQRAFGWRRVSYVSANVARGERPEPSPGALQLIARHNRLDDELYRWVGERFDAAIAADPLFEATYERFRRSNALYRPWGNLTYTLPQLIYGRLKDRGLVSGKA